jgi:hypothetical protein
MLLSYGLERTIKVETDTHGIFAIEFLNIHFTAAPSNTVTVYEI